MWGHRKLSSSVCARSSLISGNNTRVVCIASQFNSLRSEEVSKIFWAFLSDNPSITTYWGNMVSRKEYHASRNASKVYQSVSILLFSSMESAFHFCVCPWYTYLLKLLPKVFKKRIQEGLEIAPNIATLSYTVDPSEKSLVEGFNDYKILFITVFHYRYIRTVYLFCLQTETHNIIIKAYDEKIMSNLEWTCLGLLDGCLYRRVIVRVIIYLAVAVLYCLWLSAHGQLVLI
jgi:hypothetical protein